MAITCSDFLQIYLPTRFPSPGQKQRTKGKRAPRALKSAPTLSAGALGKEKQNHWAQIRLKSAAHTHTDTKEGGGGGEKKEKTKNIRKKWLFVFVFYFFVLLPRRFCFKAQLWVWSITSCCVLNKVTLCAVWIREGGTHCFANPINHLLQRWLSSAITLLQTLPCSLGVFFELSLCQKGIIQNEALAC